jgi:predicted glycosyltransferase
VHATTFEAKPEALYQNAIGVVAMGGYNTFCEFLSFDKPALIVPRTEPRQEQLIRAERAAGMGLLRFLLEGENPRAESMATALHQIAEWPRPSKELRTRLLGGLDRIAELCAPVFEPTTRARSSA